ncbi:MAG: tRNA pseudouridine(38-40) synthase TruA [Sulfurimonadaceae bacterium]|jgi:tRNA pseudouridine38-40 synthase|nr:tRNA pseudouridine(38-40) synthase TruA [Sulfurimonadaceae bacterium]
MKCKATISYDGADFYGSQSQLDGVKTINQTIQNTLKKFNIDSKIVASGRTDRGVHAQNQVIDFNLPEFWQDLPKLKELLNRSLYPSIMVKKLEFADESFHARYSTKARVYRYIIKTTPPTPFEARYVAYIKDANFEAIKRNISAFIGVWDFSNFFKKGSDTKTTTREVYRAFAYRYKGYIVLNFEANGFLRSQVRLMSAALTKLDKTQMVQMLELKKSYKLQPAPPEGLYLAKIKYNRG